MMLVIVFKLFVLVSIAFVRRRFICVSGFFCCLGRVILGGRRRSAGGIGGWLSVQFDIG